MRTDDNQQHDSRKLHRNEGMLQTGRQRTKFLRRQPLASVVFNRTCRLGSILTLRVDHQSGGDLGCVARYGADSLPTVQDVVQVVQIVTARVGRDLLENVEIWTRGVGNKPKFPES